MLKILFAFAGLSAMTSVVMGAFGAHALRASLEPRLMNAFETGVTYQMTHSLALLIVCLAAEQWGRSLVIDLAAIAFVVGILMFSGSLYGLALTGAKWLGPVTPLGGLSFIVGWLLLTIAIWKNASL